jgi:hypothetical protein
MASKTPYSISINGDVYSLKSRPSFFLGGTFYTPAVASDGSEVEDAADAMISLPSISGAELMMGERKLAPLANSLSAGKLVVILKIRAGNSISTFTLSNTSCTTEEVQEKDGVVSLDFKGGTATET